MKTKLALCAILMMAMSSPALATGSHWGNWSSWHHYDWSNLINNIKDHLEDKFNDHQWHNDCDWDWKDECDWGYDHCEEEQEKEHCDDQRGDDKCDPPSSVPSPTAGLAGLGVLGMMLFRRRNKRA